MRKKYVNPKLVGTNLIDAKPQTGLCPMNCNQCFYNRPGASFVPIDKVHIPTKKDAEGKIVRMNSLHDSNIKRYLVLRAAKKYKHVFFNTSIPQFDKLPGPIVYTANSSEEQPVDVSFLMAEGVEKLMFIRLRVSATNLFKVREAVKIIYERSDIPIVLTFMAYYNKDMRTIYFLDDGSYSIDSGKEMQCYVWKVRHVNEYWCATKEFKRFALEMMRGLDRERRVTMCGTLDSNYCKDCHNCESYYWITKRRLDDGRS